jgi:hypothetical protein
MTYKPGELLVFSADVNYYDLSGNKHTFLSAAVDYKPSKSKWEFQLSGRNLLNVQKFQTTQTTDFRYFEQNTRIMPRYIMLIAHVRL